MRLEVTVCAAIGLALFATAARPADTPAPAPATPAWKQVYQTRQTTYYLSAAGGGAQGTVRVASLIQFKVPQVIDGAQVWSVVTRMTVDCAGRRMVTLDNTSYAAKMGTGPVVTSQNPGDTWHAPQAGTLGDLILSQTCAAAPATPAAPKP
jgi:hypothetical protein